VNRAAFLYDDDAYVETIARPQRAKAGGPVGLMGRQVAGKEFLDAYLTHGRWTELVAMVRTRASADSLARLWQTHPACGARGRTLRVLPQQRFQELFFPEAPAGVLHVPSPPEARYAWARQHGGAGAYAISGITHTLSSERALEMLTGMVTAPFESCDALICISRAAEDMVREVTSTWSDYLRERFGGAPGLRARLVVIPLGVDLQRFRPPTSAERAARRNAVGATDDEVVVLYVGRLSFHAKAHPFPMYAGVAEAARRSGKKVHLVMSGWAANDSIQKAFVSGARDFAPGLRVSFADSLSPEDRTGIWHAADIYTSLPDNIQESFGLVIAQAMACGLPVVASDWNGYRDQVAEGETGLLVPTWMLRDATSNASSRLVMGELDYDRFAAETSQAVAVDTEAAAAAYEKLIRDPALRRRMGEAGRARAQALFDWAVVIRQYETLWDEQDAERKRWRLSGKANSREGHGPAIYPRPEESFARHASLMLQGDSVLVAAPGALERLPLLLASTLTAYVPEARVTDPALLQSILAGCARPVPVSRLDEILIKSGVTHVKGRATLAWMLKYSLLRPRPTS
jgi:glycosyltransferase involved in cell wall biosynthesis